MPTLEGSRMPCQPLKAWHFTPLKDHNFHRISFRLLSDFGDIGNLRTLKNLAWFPRATPNAKSPRFMFGCNPKNSENWVLTLPIFGGPPSRCFFFRLRFLFVGCLRGTGTFQTLWFWEVLRFYQVEICHLMIVGSTSPLPFSILHGFCLPCHWPTAEHGSSSPMVDGSTLLPSVFLGKNRDIAWFLRLLAKWVGSSNIPIPEIHWWSTHQPAHYAY